MADASDLYKFYLNLRGGRSTTPGTHAYEWENYIKPNAPSTDMYHQMAMYNQLENEAPKNKWLRKAFGLASFPGIAIGSPLLDFSQAALDFSNDQYLRRTKGPFTSYIADQNPFPQAWNRMKGATQFLADELNLPMGSEGSGRRQFREAYNKTFRNPAGKSNRDFVRTDYGKAYRRGGLMSLV
jgi:hypothetical protein|tara:strand:+ start:37 stop:585 length:549 start_codon:yes stop_codon:yes gene_type:complete